MVFWKTLITYIFIQKQDVMQNFVGGGLEPSIWVPSIVFLNTPNTDISLLDDKVSLTVVREGNYSLSSLDNLDQVRSKHSYKYGVNKILSTWRLLKIKQNEDDLWYQWTEIAPLRYINIIILHSSTIVLTLLK